tara:strand:+ start:659 stop:1174 length:516 start_codon:yes stop_codon:yes gene_type:complete
MSTLNVTNIKSADGTSALTIANSTGVVTQTVPPSITTPIIFQGYSRATYTSAGTWVAFYETIDTANAYNNSTGVFTCPRAGYYQMAWHALHRGNSGSFVRMNFHKNGSVYGSPQASLYADGETGDENNIGFSMIIECAASDTLAVVITDINGGDIYGASNSHNGLSIHFIG